jgi:AAA domain/F-box domain
MADGSPRQPAKHLRELILVVNASRPATSAHGETYAVKDSFRQFGWQWDAVQKAWWTRKVVEGPELATIRAAALTASVLVSVCHLPTPTSSPAGGCPEEELTPLGRRNASAAGGSPSNRSLVARRLVLDARNQRHSTQEFPEDLLENICLFLPGATLLACRLVCKSWRCAINVYALKQRPWALASLNRSPDSAAALPSWTPAHCALAGDPATVDIVAAVTRLSLEPWPQPDERYERQALASLALLAADGVTGLSYLPRELPAELATESRLSEWATPALGLSEPQSFWAAAAALLLTAAGGQEARCIATWLHHGLPSTPPELGVAADELCHALSCLMSTQLWSDCAALHGLAADWRSVSMAALDAATPPMPRGLTPEQRAVVDWAKGLNKRVDGVPGRCAKVLAFAGTGKTLTLSSLTQELKRGMRVLYLAYNKSVKEKADKDPAFAVAQRNGVTVHPSTTCSLAFKHVVVTEAMRERLKNDVYAREVIGLLREEGLHLGPQPEKVVGQALKSCKNYFVSGDDAFGPQHVDAAAHDEPGQLQRVTALVPMLLDRMQDPSHAKFPFTHDCYVSRYARSQTLLPLDDYDLVLVDEAQDLNGATLRMLHRANRERGCHIIFAGDVHQHLYAFNGARNGLAQLNTEVTFRCAHQLSGARCPLTHAPPLQADAHIPIRYHTRGCCGQAPSS